MIRMARVYDTRERLELVVLAVAGIIDGIVAVVTLGFVTMELRPWLLFSAPEWLMRQDKP